MGSTCPPKLREEPDPSEPETGCERAEDACSALRGAQRAARMYRWRPPRNRPTGESHCRPRPEMARSKGGSRFERPKQLACALGYQVSRRRSCT